MITLNNLDDKIRTLEEQLETKDVKERKIVDIALNKKKRIKFELEKEFEKLLQDLEDKKQDIEHNYNKEISREATKLEQSNRSYEKYEMENKTKISLLTRDFEKILSNLEEKYEEKIESLENKRKVVLEDKNHV